MPIQRPVRWREGMFLRPHHFQQFDLAIESRETARALLADRHAWGVAHAAVREDRLANFVLEVGAYCAVFPDGTLVDVPGNARLPSRDFRRFAGEPGRAVDVSVGLRRAEPRRSQNGDPGGESRFVGVEEEAYDTDSGADPLALERLEANLRLFFAGEPTQGYELLPLVRLVCGPDPAQPVVVDETFSPPSLTLSASPGLRRSAEAVLARLDHVLRDVARARGLQDPRQIVMEQTLTAARPVLADLVSDGGVHPRVVYRELARLAGMLLIRDEGARAPDVVPAYDHASPGRVFEDLRRLIHELSRWAWEETYVRVPLVRAPGGDEFRAELPGSARRPGVRLYVEVLAEESLALVDALLLGAKISSPARIPLLVQRALPGIRSERQPGAPPEMPPPQPGAFFRLRVEDTPEWGEQVLAAGELAVHLRGAARDVKAFLVVALGATESGRV